MKRRNYLKSVGASVALPFTSVETEDQEQEQEEAEYSPVYATVRILGYDLNVAHISVPSEMLQRANHLYTSAGSTRLDDVETTGEWEILNILVDGQIGSVSLDDVEAREWDTLSYENIGLLFTGDSEYSFLDVFSGDQDLDRRRVEATSPAEVSIQKGGERVPIFEVKPDHII